MILHIHDNRSVFIKSAIYCFQEASLEGTHIVVGGDKNSHNLPMETGYYKLRSPEYVQFLNTKLNDFGLIFFHGLLNSNEKVLSDIIKRRNHPPIAWMLFGAEIQNSLIIPSAFLGPETRALYYWLTPYRLFVPIYRIVKRIAGFGLKNQIRNIDYFAHFIPQEMNFIYKYSGIRKPMLWNTYAILDNYIESSIVEQNVLAGTNILIGNSASFTSNHSEAFRILKKLKTEDRDIIVPLNYGNKKYQNYLVKKGRNFFGEHYKPLTEFIDKESYHKLLLSCSVMILNHYRQQALGNLLFAAWAGMRIYVRKQTTTYEFFKDQGLQIFSIEEDLNNNNPLLFSPLSEIEIKRNRDVLENIFGRENVIHQFRKSFSQFVNND